MTFGPWRSPATLDSAQARSAPQLPGVPLPPAEMPLVRDGRVLKRWTYVGAFSPELMLCAGVARVGPVPQRFWAVWDREHGLLDTETVAGAGGRRITVSPGAVRARAGDSRLELALSPAGEPVEVVSPHGRSYIWTRKTPIRAWGHYTVGMEARAFSGLGILDESAGYHARHTEWEWSAGAGTTLDGWPVVWNLVRGIHDADVASERTVWVDGRPREVPRAHFSADLDEIWGADGTLLGFETEAVRSRTERFGLVSSEYVQPFGAFTGTLPGGVELSPGEPALGVMERHRATW